MEEKSGSGSNKHRHLQHDITSTGQHEATSGSSDTSSSSSSYSIPMDVDGEEKDEENGSGSTRSDPESPADVSTKTPQWSMVSASPKTGAATPPLSPEVLPQTSDLNTVNASPKQSPAIQVMGRPSGYDPNRIPLSVFAPKGGNNAEWSVASNESLFSIQMGNNSFINKSGELNRPDDWINYQCFASDANKSNDLNCLSSGLPTVMETSSEIDRKSASTVGDFGEKEEFFLTQNSSPINPEREKEKPHTSEELRLSSSSSTVPDGKAVNPTDGARSSASTARLSNESGHSASSFAFPVFEGGGSMNADAEKIKPPPSTPPVPPKGEAEGEGKPIDPFTKPKGNDDKWFSCFSCCPLCR